MERRGNRGLRNLAVLQISDHSLFPFVSHSDEARPFVWVEDLHTIKGLSGTFGDMGLGGSFTFSLGACRCPENITSLHG
jgi:hypothetical protein